jgi:hypothetical protein
VRLLLDTHSFLWFIMGSPKLGEKALALIGDAGNEKFVSFRQGCVAPSSGPAGGVGAAVTGGRRGARA